MGVVVSLEERESNQASIEPLVALTRADMERVNAMIISRTGSAVSYTHLTLPTILRV